MGSFIDFTKTARERGISPSPWYYEDFSRPIFQHTCTDKAVSKLMVDRMKHTIVETSDRKYTFPKGLLVALERVLLDLYVRHSTTGGDGNVGIFTGNGMLSGRGSIQYKILGVAGSSLKEIVEALSFHDFIDIQKGGVRHSSKIKATHRLIDHLECYGLSMEKISCRRIWPVVWSPIREKGSDKDELLAKTRVPRELAEKRGLKNLFKLNIMLQKSDIRVGSLKLYPFEKQCRRIYKDPECESYGRIHGGIWQNIPSKARPFISINGRGVVEVDICSTHPLIAYTQEGYDLTELLEAESKPYDLSQFPGWRHEIELSAVIATDREILKQGLMNCFNCGSQVQAQQALWEAIRTHKDKYTKKNLWWPRYKELEKKGITYPAIIEALRQKHWRIEGWLFQDGSRAGWLRLNVWESEIALRVLQHFSAIGVPVLPIHDSFIVQANRKQELVDVLVHAIQEVLGVKFKNKHLLYGFKRDTGQLTMKQAEHLLTDTRIKQQECIHRKR